MEDMGSDPTQQDEEIPEVHRLLLDKTSSSGTSLEDLVGCLLYEQDVLRTEQAETVFHLIDQNGDGCGGNNTRSENAGSPFLNAERVPSSWSKFV